MRDRTDEVAASNMRRAAARPLRLRRTSRIAIERTWKGRYVIEPLHGRRIMLVDDDGDELRIGTERQVGGLGEVPHEPVLLLGRQARCDVALNERHGRSPVWWRSVAGRRLDIIRQVISVLHEVDAGTLVNHENDVLPWFAGGLADHVENGRREF